MNCWSLLPTAVLVHGSSCTQNSGDFSLCSTAQQTCCPQKGQSCFSFLSLCFCPLICSQPSPALPMLLFLQSSLHWLNLSDKQKIICIFFIRFLFFFFFFQMLVWAESFWWRASVEENQEGEGREGALKTSPGCSDKQNHPTEQRVKVLHKTHWHAIYRQVVRMQFFASSGWKSSCFGENAVDIWNQNNDCFERTAQAFLAENNRELQFLRCWLQAFVSKLIREGVCTLPWTNMACQPAGANAI